MRHLITTRSGRRVNLKNPKPESIDITDIAFALARVARFTGHTKDFISVGQHCVHAMEWLREQGEPPVVQLYGLLHDAPEAYINDVARPLKQLLPIYYTLEKKWMKAILKGLQLDKVLCLTMEQLRIVKLADNSLAIAERRDQINHGGAPCPKDYVGTDAKAWDRTIEGWDMHLTYIRFLAEYHMLVAQL